MKPRNPEWPPSAQALRAAFDDAPSYTVGIEDEVMLLSRDRLELVPHAPAVLERLDGDPRFKLELPASQMEIITPSARCVSDVVAALLDGRRALAQRTEDVVSLGAAGAHPFSPGVGELNKLPRYQRTITEYAQIARRQLVCALQVHVSVGGAERALAVYNAARSYLPLLAALGANAPFYEGADTGLASVRPKISKMLPRQGVPPFIESWDAFAETLRWGAATGSFPSAQSWWWELRPHHAFGTLEFRVPDGQSSVADAAGIAALAQALVAWLGERHDAGERLSVAAAWRIEENSWSACRHGVEGEMSDLETGERRATRRVLSSLLDELEPTAQRLGAAAELLQARRMVEVNGAIAQRQVARTGGARAVARWLSERFLQPPSG